MSARSWVRVALAMFGVGWGANQFAPLLLVYRSEQHLSETAVTAVFGVYALGLIPALVIAGRYSDRHGRRGVIRLALVLSLIASGVLLAGVAGQVWLFLGRLLAGIASGVAFSAGSAWVKELSAGAAGGAGARRATLSLSGGFGGGPLIAGAVAEWAPAPQISPYLAHVVLMLVVIPLVWNAPDVSHRRARTEGRTRQPVLPRVAGDARFLLGVAVWAPWVFGTCTIAFAVMPTLVAGHLSGHPIALSGVLTGLTMFTGILVQPLARRIGHRSALLPTVTALLGTGAGLCTGVLVAVTRNPWLVPLVAVLLGAAYGMFMVSGLRRVEQLAEPHELASLAAVFYALTYLGFAAPYLLAVVAPHFGYAWCLLGAALIALVSVAPVVVAARMSALRANRVGGEAGPDRAGSGTEVRSNADRTRS